ncbi:MAG: bifunctional precorrin-2 dehydrogenase/sirohydrochlorin ferrochelatase [Candidatus Riflebacteria bacterium]|nr:bifunctional precorrin-2 dehydrogenase/sirohydrochlorin ferrochelatase [Candidatus Riflebacteria bacterium]
MQYMPLFIDLNDRNILFVGGGNVALRKARQFAEAGAQIHVIAPEINEEFNRLAKVSFEQRKAVPEDISDKYFAVIFASSDKETNEKLSKICKEKRIIVDRCDDHSKSDFVTGSITAKGSIINSTVSGGIPALSSYLNKEIEKLFTNELIELNKLLIELRPAILSSKKLGTSFMSSLVNKENLLRIKEEGIDLLKQEILACL